jgi:hypothetical protein
MFINGRDIGWVYFDSWQRANIAAIDEVEW